ncbi:MAG: glycosyltransferase [Actinomycetota bacterium]|nr:glycosyltransferase [Actinomycetota bacterium]
MKQDSPYDVCAASVSELPFDARVWKESRSLAGAGYRLALLGCSSQVDATASRTTEEGIDVTEVPFGKPETRGGILQRIGVMVALSRQVLRTRARIYHSHNVEIAPAVWLAAKLRRATLIYDAHELYHEPEAAGLRPRIEGFVWAAIERLMMRSADAVITTNRSRADVLERAYGRDDLVVLGNVPARRDEFEPIDPGYPAGKRILLYQGIISAEGRAFRETMEALAGLPDDVHFVIIGFAREERLQMIRDWARELGIEERVHLLPPRPFDELVGTAALADVGLVPIYPSTLNNYLGDTNKIFEYLMAGIPVVASDLPEIHRVATDGTPRVGEVFDPHSAESVKRAIESVLADDDLLAARRREARRLALEKYNWGIEERKLLALYDRQKAAA